MDDLEFRRKVFADPLCDDKELQKTAASDPAKQALLDDVRQFDDKLKQALNIDVPANLAAQILARQNPQNQQAANQSDYQSKQKTPLGKRHLALAASMAFAVGIAVQTLYTPFNPVNSGEYSLAHLDHEASYLHGAQGDNTLEQVNIKLARFGGKFEQPMGKTVFANFCDFNGVTSLHLIYEDADQNRITVFITPKDSEFNELKFVEEFANDQYVGRGLAYDGAKVTIVGENQAAINRYSQKIDQSLNWKI
ncbi:MAG: hypothetical protein ACI8WB_005389 [Phenylobacterium sp.]|jgi:hypothetical protein